MSSERPSRLDDCSDADLRARVREYGWSSTWHSGSSWTVEDELLERRPDIRALYLAQDAAQDADRDAERERVESRGERWIPMRLPHVPESPATAAARGEYLAARDRWLDEPEQETAR